MSAYSENELSELTLRDLLARDRTILANERTFLSYIRTSLGLFAGGATLWSVYPNSTQTHIVASLLAVIGILILAIGLHRYLRVRAHLKLIGRVRKNSDEPPNEH